LPAVIIRVYDIAVATSKGITEALRLRILRGELPPGQALPQDELAAAFGVSKIPVREALQRLDAEGVVELVPNRGAVVRTLDAARARELYGLRRGLERALLAEAVPRLTIVDLAEAEHALASGEPTDPVANWRFHRALYRASGWYRGLALLEPMFAVVSPYLVLYTERLGAGSRSHDEHGRLLDRCREGDAGGAVAELVAHLTGAEAALVDHLEVIDRSRQC
jgi:DNA-binding GntR family transcriptional regulator